MAESTPLPPAETTGDIEYRPVSIMAIAALVIAGLYALFVLISVAAAFLRGEPFFLSTWVFALPIAGSLLALVALHRIKDSGGILAGDQLARWALGLSVVAGLGYGTFSVFTGLAVQQQANRFLTELGTDSGFFPRLLKGEVNSAFLLTQPLTTRRGANPLDLALMATQFDAPLNDKNPKGKLTLFQENGLVRVLAQQGENGVIVEPLGVKEWVYEHKGYRVDRNYRIATPEATYEMLLTVQSFETGDPEMGRKWQVVWGPANRLPPPKEVTPLGQKLFAARDQSALFANAWVRKLNEGKLLEAFLETRPAGERKDLYVQIENQAKRLIPTQAAALWSRAATLTPGIWSPLVLPSPSHEDFLRHEIPGYSNFAGLTFLRGDRLRAPEGVPVGKIRALLPILPATRGEGGGLQLQIKREDAFLSPLEQTAEKKARIAHSFELTLSLPEPGESAPSPYLVLGKVIVEADAIPEGQPARGWRLVEIEFQRVIPIPRQRLESQ